MKVQATKTMAKLLNNKIPRIHIDHYKFSPAYYQAKVDYDIFDHDNDYDINTNTYRTISVTYPYDYYAQQKYITTNDLIKIFNNCDKTLDDFIKKFSEYIGI